MEYRDLAAYMRKHNLQGLSPAGLSYVEKVSHPPAKVDGYAGVPDPGARNAVRLQFVAETGFSPELTVGKSATESMTVNPSAMLFLQPSGAKAGVYMFLRYDGGWTQPQTANAAAGTAPAIQQANVPASIVHNYNFRNWPLDVGCHRTTYRSTTYRMVGTDYNNAGTVASVSFKPNLVSGNDLHAYAASLTPRDLKAFLSILPEHAFVRGDDAGVPVCNFEVVEPRRRAPRIKRTLDAVSPDVRYQMWEVPSPSAEIVYPDFSPNQPILRGALPDDIGRITQMSNSAVIRPAKLGSFVVQNPIESVQPWIPNVQTTSPETTAGDRGLMLSFIRSTNAAGGHIYLPLICQNFSTPGFVETLDGAYDTAWNNLDWSMTLFQDLYTPAPGTTSLTNVSRISATTYIGIEFEPGLNGSFLPVAITRPLPDPQALLLASTIAIERADSQPASDNDFGSFIQGVLNFVPVIGPWLKNLLGPRQEAQKPPVRVEQTTKHKKKRAPAPPPRKQQQQPKRTAHKQSKPNHRQPPPVPARKPLPQHDKTMDQLLNAVRKLTTNRR